MLIRLLNFLFDSAPAETQLDIDLSAFFHQHVEFYRRLNPEERLQFEKRALAFISTTRIVGEGVEVTDEDRLLVAASAVIPVWKFPGWHYFNLHCVFLVAGFINRQGKTNQPDSTISGMVRNDGYAGQMILSKPALHLGFSNTFDKRNVGIHEFVHLIDMSDGSTDGFPERLSTYAFSIPWLNMVREHINDIAEQNSNIDQYASTDPIEFFAVVSEYFFERPELLQRKHPDLYDVLSNYYQMDLASIEAELLPRRKAPCPCGSGKKYKNCCAPD